MRRFLVLLAFLWAGGALPATEAPASTQEQKIEALLTQIAAQPDVQFVRNGKAYDAPTAVKFLRAKWDRQRAEISNVRDFIDKIASKSSTTGQAYLIKFKDGRTIACRDFLTQLVTAP